MRNPTFTYMHVERKMLVYISVTSIIYLYTARALQTKTHSHNIIFCTLFYKMEFIVLPEDMGRIYNNDCT